MSSREKDQADFDLETFVDLFDTAMTSDNPTVKRALRNLLMVVSIAQAEDTKQDAGPLRRLVEDINHLNRRLTNVESSQQQPYTNPWTITPGTPTPSIPLGPYVAPSTVPGQPWWGTGTGTPLYKSGQGGTTTSTGYVQVNQGATATSSTTTYTKLLDKLEAK